MTKLAHITCINKYMNKDDITCEACILAKFHRQPFSVSNSMASMAFELVHMDLWGPYRVPDLTGASYFLTVADDHTRCTWVYLLQNKMQVPTYAQNFITYVQISSKGKSSVLEVIMGWSSFKTFAQNYSNSMELSIKEVCLRHLYKMGG